MQRPHFHPGQCKVCGIAATPEAPISQTGLCRLHGFERMNQNLSEMKTKRGPFAAWWAYRIADAAWGVSVDEMPPRP